MLRKTGFHERTKKRITFRTVSAHANTILSFKFICETLELETKH